MCRYNGTFYPKPTVGASLLPLRHRVLRKNQHINQQIDLYNTTPYTFSFKKLRAVFYLTSTLFLLPSISHAEAEVLVLKHEMRQGEILTPQDLDWETTLNVPAGAVQNPLDIIGKSAKNHLKAGLVMYPNLFEMPKLILQGQTVEVVFQSGELDIRYSGVATQDGTKGQLINIRMPSGTILGATVLEPGRVLVP